MYIYQNQIASPAIMANFIQKALSAFYPKLKYRADENAPNSYKELIRYDGALNGYIELPVYNGGSEKTIFGQSDNEINVAFRAWHDAVHLENGLSFSFEDELKTAKIQCDQLRALKAPYNVTVPIYWDIHAQALYYSIHTAYVKNQRAFMDRILNAVNNRQSIKWIVEQPDQ